MGVELLEGAVRFFNNNRGKRFGFVMTESGEDLFFHFNQGRRPVLTADGVYLGGKTPERDPEPGDAVRFELSEGRKGVRAGIWCYASDYEKLSRLVVKRTRFRAVNGTGPALETGDEKELEKFFLSFCDQRVKSFEAPTMKFQRMNPLGNWVEWVPSDEVFLEVPCYRIVKTTRFFNRCEPMETVAWSGSRTKDLVKDHPIRKGGVGDFLPLEFRDFSTDFRFQEMDTRGNWNPWHDPRPLPYETLRFELPTAP